jgi:hypothetical protein
VKSLTQVSASIEKKLADERRKQALTVFIAAWRKKWIAQTNCDTGYVTQKCRQYTGLKTPEEPLALN